MRGNGILLHITSLPSDYGIGTFGKQAYKFVDFLKEAKQTYWQILPICPTSFGDSPYQSFCTYAGNPYFIDFDILKEDGLLLEEEYKDIKWFEKEDSVDYGLIYQNRYNVLQKAYERFDINDEKFNQFIIENEYWLDEYALYMHLKKKFNDLPWYKWDKPFKDHDFEFICNYFYSHLDEINFYRVIQYLFFKQWQALKDYANINGIHIIGDLPIYVSLDSVEVWSNSHLFKLDDDKMPLEVAGVPGDYFNEDGQLWGNPLYDWDKIKADNYKFWTDRIGYLFHLFDILRLDHFRGFSEYYSIPSGDETAKNGVWLKGPGYELFEVLENKFGKLNIVAEDLGDISENVKELLDKCKFPGMKVLEFAFNFKDHNSDYLPHNLNKNCIAYIGTHDNDTIEGYLKTLNKQDKEYLVKYLRLNEKEGYRLGIMRSLWASVADTTIIQAQDLLGLDSTSRMNTPATSGINWKWRAKKDVFTKKMAKDLAKDMELYNRI